MTGPVVKLGGSLFADPHLRDKLAALFAETPGRCLIVAGGGAFADAVRRLDAVHNLGEAAAHLVALQSLHASAAFARHLVSGRADVLDAPAFLREFEALHGPVAAAWSLTTDTLAAFAAAHFGRELILLKSVTMPPGGDWRAAAANGHVDGEFAAAVERFGLTVTARNWRA